jgi:DNA replication protein DnaC
MVNTWVDDLAAGQVIRNPGNPNTGRGLLFYGPPGVGKTTSAAVAAMEAIRRIEADTETRRTVLGYNEVDFGLRCRPVYYLTVADYLRQKKMTFNSSGEERARMTDELDGYLGLCKDDRLNVRVLVLDDINKQYGSEYDDFSFDEILRMRYDRALPTIVTTNTPANLWAGKYGQVMESFFNEAFIPVEVQGVDLRKYPGGEGA